MLSAVPTNRFVRAVVVSTAPIIPVCRGGLQYIFLEKKFKYRVCRVPEALPSVFYRALGKDHVCRVPEKYNRQTKTHGKICLCRVFFLALGKEAFCRVHFFWPSANQFFEAIFEALNEFK